MILDQQKYSIVIAPPQTGLNYVDHLKDELNGAIGWYHSRNSKAHVTISEFTADEDELAKVTAQLKEIASYENPIHLNFEGVGNYVNGAVFLKPDEATKIEVGHLMKRMQKKLSIKNAYHSKEPHISIGRKLTEENVQMALKIFAEAKLDFNCDHLVLRKFNPTRKQYDVYSDDFKFVGTEPRSAAQQSLF